MRTSSSLFALVILIAAAQAQPDRINLYTTPSLPPSEVVERLNLKQAWAVLVVTAGKRDTVISAQLAPVRRDGKIKLHLVVQTRSGLIQEIDAETGQSLYRVEVGIPYTATVPLGFNTTDVVAARGGDLYGVNRSNGDVRWKLPLHGGVPVVAPLVDARHVYLNLGSTQVAVYDLPIRGEDKPKLSRTHRATIPLQLEAGQNESYLFYPSPRGSVSVLFKENAGLYLRFNTGGTLSASPGLHEVEGGVYIGARDTNLYGYSLLVSEPSWRYSVGAPIDRKPFVTDEEVLVTGEGKGLFRLYRRTLRGAELIRVLRRKGLATDAQMKEVVDSLGARRDEAVAILDRLVEKRYMTQTQKSALKWRGGDLLWINPEGERVLASNEKFVYSMDRAGRLLVIDREHGRTLSRYDLSEYPVAITNELTDRIYLGAHNGQFVCLHDRDIPEPRKRKAQIEPVQPAPPPPPGGGMMP